MKKVFIDCGANTGNGLRQFISMFNIDSEWIIESFEPNENLKLHEDLLNLPNLFFYNKAVWDKTGEIDFSICDNSNEAGNINCLLDSGYTKDKNRVGYQPHNHIVKVQSIDIVDILKKYSNDDYIVIKLDVEGSEFAICRRLIESGEIKKINELYIEWHTDIMSSEVKENENDLKLSIKQQGVNLHDWY